MKTIEKNHCFFGEINIGDWSNIHFEDCVFESMELLGKVKGARFTNCEFRECNAKDCHFHSVSFVGCRMKSLILDGSFMTNCEIERCSFRNVNFGVDAISSSIHNSEFASCVISDASFSECQIEDTRLYSCKVKDSSLFSETTIRDVMLEDSLFDNNYTDGAIISDISIFTTRQF